MTSRRNPPSLLRLVVMVLAVGSTLVACGGDDGDGAGVIDDVLDGSGAVEGDDAGEAAWTDADLERLIATPVDGYSISNANVSEFGNATVQYVEDTPSTTVALSALVTFQACDFFVCTDLSVEPDEQVRANVRSLLPSIHIDNPDLVEEIGPIQLAGRTALAIYFRSFIDEDGSRSTALSYRAITHDGANLITVQVSPDFNSAGGLAASADELAARMSPADGAAVAEDILTAFSGEFG